MMKNLFVFLFLYLSFVAYAAIGGEMTMTDQVETKDQVTHIQEVYKTIEKL